MALQGQLRLSWLVARVVEDSNPLTLDSLSQYSIADPNLVNQAPQGRNLQPFG